MSTPDFNAMSSPMPSPPVDGESQASLSPNSTALVAALPPTLMPVDGEDFLPGPGPWASALGRQLILLFLLGFGAMAVWPMRETVRASGVVRPTGENNVIQSEQGGTLQRVLMRPNQVVQPGDLLAVFDSRSVQAERQQLRDELATLERQAQQARAEQSSLDSQFTALNGITTSLTESSRRNVEQARASLNFENSELQRYRSLLESGAVPRSLVDEKQARQIMGEAEVLKAMQSVSEQRARGLSELARLQQSASQARSSADELSKQVAQRRARLLQVQRAIDFATVRSPIHGSVVTTNLNHSGQVLQPGEVMAVLAPLSQRYQAKLQVPADSISHIKVGQYATLKISACPTSEFGVMPAVVRNLSADTVPTAAQPGSAMAAQSPLLGRGASAYEVVVEPKYTSLKGRLGNCQLRLGMEVNADIVTRRTTVFAYLMNKLRIGA
jgi:multidrug efflux pump subunit AcrA (membrane-fusion protein)